MQGICLKISQSLFQVNEPRNKMSPLFCTILSHYNRVLYNMRYDILRGNIATAADPLNQEHLSTPTEALLHHAPHFAVSETCVA